MTKVQKEERIVEQAAGMFERLGIKAVRMDDIATELGVSKRTLYELFGDKEELIYRSLKWIVEKQRQQHTQLISQAANDFEAIFLIIQQLRQQAPTTKRMSRNLKKFYPSVYERFLNEGSDKHRRGLITILERCREQGLILEGLNLEMIAASCQMINETLRNETENLIPDSMSDEEIILQFTTILLRGISTPNGIQLIDEYTKKYSHTLA